MWACDHGCSCTELARAGCCFITLLHPRSCLCCALHVHKHTAFHAPDCVLCPSMRPLTSSDAIASETGAALLCRVKASDMAPARWPSAERLPMPKP